MTLPSREDVDTLFRVHRSPEAIAERLARSRDLDVTRSWVDDRGYALSDRVWLAGLSNRMSIDSMIRMAIAQGTDALTAAKTLEAYLLPEQRPLRLPSGRLVRNQPKRIVTAMPEARPLLGNLTASKGSYPARRLMRTEISRAHGHATVKAVAANPLSVGVRWRISGSHPKPDECDDKADADVGLGRGIYPVNQVPRHPSHPHCLCCLTPASVTDPAERKARIAALRRQYGLDVPPLEQEIAAQAQRLYDAAAAVEPITSQDVGEVAGLINATMPGPQFRLKSVDSIVQKIKRGMGAEGTTTQEAAEAVRDTLRYTMVVEEDTYQEALQEAVAELVDRGHVPVRVTNGWAAETGPTGNTMVFQHRGHFYELQVHTPASIAAKETARPLYDAWRKLDPLDDLSTVLDGRIDAIWAGIRQNTTLGDMPWLTETFGMNPQAAREVIVTRRRVENAIQNMRVTVSSLPSGTTRAQLTGLRREYRDILANLGPRAQEARGFTELEALFKTKDRELYRLYRIELREAKRLREEGARLAKLNVTDPREESLQLMQRVFDERVANARRYYKLKTVNPRALTLSPDDLRNLQDNGISFDEYRAIITLRDRQTIARFHMPLEPLDAPTKITRKKVVTPANDIPRRPGVTRQMHDDYRAAANLYQHGYVDKDTFYAYVRSDGQKLNVVQWYDPFKATDYADLPWSPTMPLDMAKARSKRKGMMAHNRVARHFTTGNSRRLVINGGLRDAPGAWGRGVYTTFESHARGVGVNKGGGFVYEIVPFAKNPLRIDANAFQSQAYRWGGYDRDYWKGMKADGYDALFLQHGTGSYWAGDWYLADTRQDMAITGIRRVDRDDIPFSMTEGELFAMGHTDVDALKAYLRGQKLGYGDDYMVMIQLYTGPKPEWLELLEG